MTGLPPQQDQDAGDKASQSQPSSNEAEKTKNYELLEEVRKHKAKLHGLLQRQTYTEVEVRTALTTLIDAAEKLNFDLLTSKEGQGLNDQMEKAITKSLAAIVAKNPAITTVEQATDLQQYPPIPIAEPTSSKDDEDGQPQDGEAEDPNRNRRETQVWLKVHRLELGARTTLSMTERRPMMGPVPRSPRTRTHHKRRNQARSPRKPLAAQARTRREMSRLLRVDQ